MRRHRRESDKSMNLREKLTARARRLIWRENVNGVQKKQSLLLHSNGLGVRRSERLELRLKLRLASGIQRVACSHQAKEHR